MNKKLLAAALFLLFITANCKKSSTPVTPVNITGTWTLNNELQTINTVQTLYEVSVIPCMGENTLTINANGTFTTAYSGADTCYLYNNQGGSSLSFGTPGLTGTGTWTQNGNNVALTYIYSTGNETVNATTKTTTTGMQLIITGSDPSIHLTAVITYTNY